MTVKVIPLLRRCLGFSLRSSVQYRRPHPALDKRCIMIYTPPVQTDFKFRPGEQRHQHAEDVVLLEEGGYHPTDSFTSPIPERAQRLYRNGGVTPFAGKPIVGFGEGCCLGGSTVVNAGYYNRPPLKILEHWSRDFDLRGYSSEELEPYFQLLEKRLTVSTHEDKLTNLDSRALEAGCNKLGWRIEPSTRVLTGCRNRNECTAGCPTGAKRSMLLNYLPAAIQAGVRVFTDAKVVSLVKNPTENRIQ